MEKSNPSIMSRFVNELKEAENALKYTLHLNDAFPLASELKLSNKNLSSCIDDILGGINNDMDEFRCKGTFNFFGFMDFKRNSNDPSSEKNDDLAVLSTSWFFWDQILKQDAIIFSFVTLRKLITSNNNFNYSEKLYLSKLIISEEGEIILADDSDGTYENTSNGLDFLLQNNSSDDFRCIIKLSEDAMPIISIEETPANVTKTTLSPLISNYKRSITNFSKNLKTLDPNFLSRLFSDPLYTGFQNFNETLSLFEFFNYTIENRPKDTPNSKRTGILPILKARQYKSEFTKSDCRSYITSVNRLFAHVNPGFLDVRYELEDNAFQALLPSDKIYLMYQIETLFAPMMIDCLYQNIIPTLGTPYNLCESSTINFLSSCLELPNVFSRQYIVQMAIETITKHFDADFNDQNFFDYIKESSPHTFAFTSDSKKGSLKKYSKMDHWKDQYNQMMNYLIHILFPVYENYFFCVFWDTVKHTLEEEGGCTDDAEVAKKMYEFLRDYLNSDDTVNSLFDINTAISQDFSLPKTINSHVVHPDFTSDGSTNSLNMQPINRSIYKGCINTTNLSSDNTQSGSDNIQVPDFISLSYLDKLLDSTKKAKDIQDFYIIKGADL